METNDHHVSMVFPGNMTAYAECVCGWQSERWSIYDEDDIGPLLEEMSAHHNPAVNEDRPLAAAIYKWHETNYPNVSDYRVGCKLAEEAGEVCGAIVKMAEGRKALDDLMDELGDVLVVVSTLAGRMGTTPDELLKRRWEDVRHRKNENHSWEPVDNPISRAMGKANG